MSVFAAVTAVFIKTLAEKSLPCHIQFLRELLDDGVLAAIVWLDTRGMWSDGLTKERWFALPDGETVSTVGTHLGHNLPDRNGNRYCINLVSVAGRPTK